MIVLSNADISGMYLVQSVDYGVHHHCGTTTAVHTAAHSYVQLQTLPRQDENRQ